MTIQEFIYQLETNDKFVLFYTPNGQYDQERKQKYIDTIKEKVRKGEL